MYLNKNLLYDNNKFYRMLKVNAHSNTPHPLMQITKTIQCTSLSNIFRYLNMIETYNIFFIPEKKNNNCMQK